jgi:hypothetical protein
LPPGASEYYARFATTSSLNVRKIAAKIQEAAWSATPMKPTTREFSAAIVLLWVLLTGFFWLGYWVGGQDRLDRATAGRPGDPVLDTTSPWPGSKPAPEPETREPATKRDAPTRL